MKVLTHHGTGSNIVSQVVRELGGEIRFVGDRETAYSAPMTHLLLLGGADISPFLYGEPVFDARPTAKDRDGIEWILARRAIQDGLPILGICRGHQMLSVALGAALWQDMDNCLGVDHHAQHKVKVFGALADVMPTLTVNSLHHQAVKAAPYGFEQAAIGPGGVIEAVYRPGTLGVQWHPELLLQYDPRWMGIFEWWREGLK